MILAEPTYCGRCCLTQDWTRRDTTRPPAHTEAAASLVTDFTTYMRCLAGIRNPSSHEDGLPELAENEALEQLAAFSVLARWVEAAALST